MRSLVAAAAFALGLAASDAHAADVISDDPVITSVAVLGTLGGLTTSIAAIVYASEGRTFDDAWVVTSLFTTAICGAMTAAIAMDAPSTGGAMPIVGTLFFGTLAAWPAYWTVKSSLADADPGEPFDAPLDVEPPRVVPDDAPARTLSTGPAIVVPVVAMVF
ncbi:hypothetical protein L6R52_20715 [Myxococcota bacterium]|nr:hypothetical protein [Myxococcota bacterium]